MAPFTLHKVNMIKIRIKSLKSLTRVMTLGKRNLSMKELFPLQKSHLTSLEFTEHLIHLNISVLLWNTVLKAIYIVFYMKTVHIYLTIKE
jgi:hypothetical protein